MTQTVPATAVLGPGKTGLTIGVTVLNIDGTEYAAFDATGVVETSVAGTYRKENGVVVPDEGAYLVWGESGTDYAEATVEPVQTSAPSVEDIILGFNAADPPPAANVTYQTGEELAGALVSLDTVLEGGLTVGEALRVLLAVLAGKSTGGGTYEIAFRDMADGKDRVVVAVDGNGNRTAIALDGSE